MQSRLAPLIKTDRVWLWDVQQKDYSSMGPCHILWVSCAALQAHLPKMAKKLQFWASEFFTASSACWGSWGPKPNEQMKRQLQSSWPLLSSALPSSITHVWTSSKLQVTQSKQVTEKGWLFAACSEKKKKHNIRIWQGSWLLAMIQAWDDCLLSE